MGKYHKGERFANEHGELVVVEIRRGIHGNSSHIEWEWNGAKHRTSTAKLTKIIRSVNMTKVRT